MQRLHIGLGVGVTVATATLLGTFIGASQPAFADGRGCTHTANTQTCIEIRGTGDRVDWITATHHNNHPSGPGKFELTGPGLDAWSPMLPYAGGGNTQYQWNEKKRTMTEGTYCVQWFVNGDSRFPETGKGCATVHK